MEGHQETDNNAESDVQVSPAEALHPQKMQFFSEILNNL